MKAAYSSKRDAKKLCREVKPGQKLYTVHRLVTNLPIQKDVYSEHTVSDQRSFIFGNPLLEGGYTSVEGLVYREGTVYLKPPHGTRNLADPLPQIAEPIAGGRDGWRHFSRAEITALEKEVRRAREETRRG